MSHAPVPVQASDVISDGRAEKTLLDLQSRPSLRGAANTLATVMLAGAAVVVAIPLALLVWSVVARGAHIAFAQFPAFFTDEIPIVSRRAGPGMGPAIVGTVLVTGGATLIAVPLGVLGATYTNEYGGKSHFARLVRFMAMVMTGVPSIVMGLFVYIVWTIQFGFSAFGGALALACLMLPIVIGSTEQMLKLVPGELREAAYALGATQSRVTLSVVLPAALPGIVSGALLAVARAAGETAPLLFAVGAATSYNPDLFRGANTALPVQIFGNATSVFVGAQERAWGAALTLVGVTFLASLAARLFTSRFAIKR
jgi:phosphate transport system permease protein